jgi:hypothetical protein
MLIYVLCSGYLSSEGLHIAHDNAIDFVFSERRTGFYLEHSQVRKLIKKSLTDIGVCSDYYSSHSLQSVFLVHILL